MRFVFCLVLLGFAACATASDVPVVAITHVTVISATGAPARADQTVLIRGARIEAVGPSGSVAVPRGANVLDGTGKFLIPGLIDMHVHTSKTRASALGLYLAYGVTTVRDAGSEQSEVMRWRAEIDSGAREGPRMLIAGPYLESQGNIERMRADPPEERVEPFERARIAIGTPERARAVIDSLAATGIDFFKIRTVQDSATYVAIVQAATARGKIVIGHVNANSPEDIIRAGQKGVEHGWQVTMDSLSRDERMAIWRALAAAGVSVTPTLVVYSDAVFATDSAARVAVGDTAGIAEPQRRYVSRFLALDWREQYAERTPEVSDAWRALHRSMVRNYGEMHEAGVRLVTGSDAAVIGIYPGSALHRELQHFVEQIGMTPLEAIERATRLPAEFLGIADSVGTIQPGRIADLVLLDADPLADIRATMRISTVFRGGRIYDQAGLAELRAAVLRSPDIKTNDWLR